MGATPCPSASAITGSDGNVMVGTHRVARIMEWSITANIQVSEWGDSDAGGFTNRKRGRRDATGTIGGKFDTDFPVNQVFEEGDSAVLVLFETATRYWYFSCGLITEYSTQVNVDSGEVVGWSANFGSDGIFYRPGDAGAPNITLPAAPTVGP